MNVLKKITTQKITRDKLVNLTTILLLFWIPVIIFSKIAGEILEKEPIGCDQPILLWIHSFHTPLLDNVFLFFTNIANPLHLLMIALLVLGFLVFKQQKLNALFLILGVGGAAAANFILKIIFQRTRPDFWPRLITETDYSFPSGHSMISMALITCIIIMLWHTRWKVLALVLGIFLIIMVGVSRLYLGVHYPSDVIAGWSIGLVWVLIVLVMLRGASLRSHAK